MGEKMKQFLQKESNMDADEILKQVNADPEFSDVYAPAEMEEALFARINAYEKEKAHSNLSEEDKELIELGKIYKKRRKRRKATAIATLALVGLLGSGITAMGGPEKAIEKVRWIIADREQTNVDADSERIEKPEVVSELEAFEIIEKKFGFTPIKMYYVPEGMNFQRCMIDYDTQYVNLLYQGEKNRIIVCEILSNYKIGSHGKDIEDTFLEEYTKKVSDVDIFVKHYNVDASGEERWSLEFEKNHIYYFIQMSNVNDKEVEKIIDNLYFPN